MSRDLNDMVESAIFDNRDCISRRLAVSSSVEKQVLRWVIGRPGTMAIAASEKVQSRMDNLGIESSAIRRRSDGGSTGLVVSEDFSWPSL